MSTELNLKLPDNLAKEAAANGLLSQEAIEQLIRDEIERRNNEESNEGSLRKITGRELFENLNAVYTDASDDEEKEYRRQMKRHHLCMLGKLKDDE